MSLCSDVADRREDREAEKNPAGLQRREEASGVAFPVVEEHDALVFVKMKVKLMLTETGDAPPHSCSCFTAAPVFWERFDPALAYQVRMSGNLQMQTWTELRRAQTGLKPLYSSDCVHEADCSLKQLEHPCVQLMQVALQMS